MSAGFFVVQDVHLSGDHCLLSAGDEDLDDIVPAFMEGRYLLAHQHRVHFREFSIKMNLHWFPARSVKKGSQYFQEI